MLGFMIEPNIWTPLVLQSVHESPTTPNVQGIIWASLERTTECTWIPYRTSCTRYNLGTPCTSAECTKIPYFTSCTRYNLDTLELQSVQESSIEPLVQGIIWTPLLLQSVHDSPTAPHVQGIIYTHLKLRSVQESPAAPHVQGIIWTPLELQSVQE